MISIIICSRDEQKLREVSTSVAYTIGVDHEIIAIDNSQGTYSIFQAYNLGIERSKYEVLCFMHEDIILKTQDWGRIVEALFASNSALGLVGVAGCSYKTQMPSHWSFPNSLRKAIYVNIIQHYQSSGQVVHHVNNPGASSLGQVVAVDGVWFCAPRHVFEKVRFDDQTYRHFHCYDVDFSLSVYQHYQVAVTFEVLIEHLSEGSFNTIWLDETVKLHQKWQAVLPLNPAGLSLREQYSEEKSAFVDFVYKMVRRKHRNPDAKPLLWNAAVRRRFGVGWLLSATLSTLKRLATDNS